MQMKGILVLCNKIHTHHEYFLNKSEGSYKWEFSTTYPFYLKKDTLYYLLIRRRVQNIKSFEFIEKDLDNFTVTTDYIDLDHPTLKNKKVVYWF